MDIPAYNDARQQQENEPASQSRRNLLAKGAFAGFAGMFATPSLSAQTQKEQPAGVEINVRSFGAAGDGISDDTAAFQRALDSVHHAGGGTAFAPTGRYLFRGVLTIPEGVTLRGSFSCVPSHTGMRDRGQPKPEIGRAHV